MRDPEFIELRNKFVIAVLVILVFGIPFLIFITKKFMVETSPIITGINKEETMLVYVEKADCKKCKTVEEILKEYGVKYYKLNSTADRNYFTVLHKIGVTTTDIDEPTLLHIEEGKFYASLVSINSKEEMLNFLLTYGYLDAENEGGEYNE
jgi:hypothetical protein